MGREEIDVIRPALDTLRAEGFDVMGPLSADTAFHPEARAILEDYYKDRDGGLNEARLRMARVPEGASLIPNHMSGAPGIRPRPPR